MKKEKLKVGSIVRIISNKGKVKHNFKIGVIAELIKIERDLVHRFIDENEGQYVSPEDYEVIRY